ncbi:hypothetical protein MMC26_004535 [Xylographa opegraphella]|nr:hypothetical protein [Xylographa opegraphella]
MDNMQFINYHQIELAGQSTSVKNDSSLCSRIQALAQEIQDMILHFLIKVSLNPGKVYFGNTISLNVFTALLKIPNHALHTEAVTTLFGNNTWVIPRGKVRDAGLLFRLPQSSLSRIRSMQLTFSWSDAWSLSSGDRFKLIYNQWSVDTGPDGEEVLAQDYYTERVAWTNEVLQIWNNKYAVVRALPLEHLKLDFSATHGLHELSPDSPLIPLVSRTFTYGVPPHLEIVAPTRMFECTIRDIIMWQNRNLVQNRVCTMCEAGLHVP